MAKEVERKALRKSRASFNLIGKVKVTDRTFSIDNTYDSGWTDNSMYLSLDCGQGNVVYAEMRGGYFPDKENVIRAYEKDRDENGKSKSIEISWEDRDNPEFLDIVADSSLLSVGVEKDVKGHTVTKKFLHAYDAVAYLNDYLEDGCVVNIRGNIGYSEYDGNVSVKKEITSIYLSNVEDEADYKATFSQTILVDSDSIGKPDKEKGTIALDAYVIDYVGRPKINGEKVDVKKNVVFPKTFEVEINPDKPEITTKMLQKFFKPKKGKISEITVLGKLVEGASVVTITEDDIPDDIKELIEMGLYSEEEAQSKLAVGNNSRERRMIILKPDIVYVGQDENRKPTVAYEEAKYTVDDLVFYEQAILEAGGSVEKEADESETEDSSDEDDDLMKLLANM